MTQSRNRIPSNSYVLQYAIPRPSLIFIPSWSRPTAKFDVKKNNKCIYDGIIRDMERIGRADENIEMIRIRNL